VVVRLLGAVGVFVDGTEVDLGATGPRSLLSVLAARARTVVTLDELVAALWGDRPPKSAGGGVYTYVSRLRKALEPEASRASEARLLSSSRAGYSLLVPAGAVDLHRFEAAAARARTGWAEKDAASALGQCDAALAEWAGSPLGGARGPFADAERSRLDQLKLDVQELRCAALLDTGSAGAAAAELSVLAERNPLRERLNELLMLALYSTGRQADALEVYRRVRRRLVDDLGVEPGPALRRMHQRVLGATDEPDTERETIATTAWSEGSARRATRVVPAQLPHGVSGFTGREAELRRLERLCEAAGEGTGGRSVVISAIDGAGGVGKTALAVHTAHRLVEAFPDGQLFLDLRGFDPRLPPVTAGDALGHLVRGLGAEAVEGDVDAQAALYRSLLAGRRVLVVLDNAVSAEQVRPLLPGSPGCLAIVTSRNRLAGLVARDGAKRISLDVLRPEESVALLRHGVGAGLVDADLQRAHELAALCGHLPLALRIAAERVVGSDHYELADLVGQLRDERDRLGALSTEDDESAAVRAVFSWSYYALKPEQAAAFRLLGLHPGLELGLPDAAALLGCPVPVAGRRLAGLVRGHLLEEVGRDRFRFHDLIRIYAAECAERDEPAATRDAAVERLLRWCLGAAATAREVLAPGLGAIDVPEPDAAPPPVVRTYDEAISWAGRELAMLADAVRLAAGHGRHTLAARLASALGALYHCTSRWREWLRVTEIGQAAAREAGDRLSLARLHNDRGLAHHFLGRHAEAIACHEAAVDILTSLEDAADEATVANLVVAYSMMGRHLDALPLLENAARLARERGHRFVEASVTDSLGAVLSSLGRHEEAIDRGRRAVELSRQTGAVHMLGHALLQAGTSCLRAGHAGEAAGHFGDALELWRGLGDGWGEVRSLHALAKARQCLGDRERARRLLVDALAILRDTGRLAANEPEAADIRALLTELSD
jgi:DNA-binding SARP family transcriptional activator